MNGIPVFIRDIDEADGVPLGLLDPMTFESLVAAVALFGAYTAGGGGGIRQGEAWGQFVIENDRAYFEVVVDGKAT